MSIMLENSELKLNNVILNFYSSLKTPVFFSNMKEILWHNDSAKNLLKNHHFKRYILHLKKPSNEITKVFICDECYYKILIRPYDDAFFLEVIEQWSINSTLDTSISFNAPEILDSVIRNSAHQTFQAVASLSKILEKFDSISNLNFLDKIADSTYKMLRATNLYYEYDLLLQGKTQLEIVDVFGEIDALCSTVNSLMQKSGVEFSWNLPSEKVFCNIDIHQFSFALFHLICNAYTFSTEKNKVDVKVEFSNQKLLQISIFDRGTGINPGILDKVFNPYFSYDSVTGDVAGCGLGLTYATVFAKNNGGTLTINSQDGQTAVSMAIPITPLADMVGLSSHVVDYEMGKYGYLVSTMAKFVVDM